MTTATIDHIDFGIVYGVSTGPWFEVQDLPPTATGLTASVSPGFTVSRIQRRTTMVPMPEDEWPLEWKPGGHPGHPPNPIPKVPDVVDTDVDASIPVTGEKLIYRVSADATNTARCVPVSGTLVVRDSTGTTLCTVPLSFVRGPEIVFDSVAFAAQQGQTVNVAFRARSDSAQPQQFLLSAGEWGSSAVQVPPADTVAATLALTIPTHIATGAAELVTLQIRGVIGGVNTPAGVTLPTALSATVSPAPVTVTSQEPVITAAPGTTVSVPIRVCLNATTSNTDVVLDSSSGPWASTPAQRYGLCSIADPRHLPPIQRNVDDQGALQGTLALSVPPDAAAADNLPLWIRWSAFDGAQTGYLPLDLVVPPVSTSYTAQWNQPAGTALSGFVTYTLYSNGDYEIFFHAHDSTLLTGYDFVVRAGLVIADPGDPAAVPPRPPLTFVLASQHSGEVHLNSPGDFTETGNDPRIATYWAAVKNNAKMLPPDVSSSSTGVVGTLSDIAGFFLDAVGTVVGAVVGVVIGIGHEIGVVFNGLGLGAVFSVVAGVIVYLYGGGLYYAVVAGVAAGEVADALIKVRELHPNEIALLNRVFAGQLDTTKVRLTNFTLLSGGRAFTMPSPDSSLTYLNMGAAYQPDDMSGEMGDPGSAYPAPGQLLVHEAVHAWQIQHSSFIPVTVCDGISVQTQNLHGTDVYHVDPPGLAWQQYGVEGQGALVDQWYGGIATVDAPIRTVRTSPDAPDNQNDPYFPYIRDNIRAGIT